MTTPDITWMGLLFTLLLLVIPLILDYGLRLNLIRDIYISVGRMVLQLALLGLFLEYLFKWDYVLLNIVWFLVMVFAASYSAIRRNNLTVKTYWRPIFLALGISVGFVVLYFNALVIEVEHIFSARFFIIISGMVLGNAMKGVIIVLDKFITGIRRDKNQLLYRLSAGANQYEALRPWIRASLRASLQPIIATTATMGLVSIPGMMTGQILGGVSPLLAIKYQMAIVVAILVAMMMAVVLAVFFVIGEEGKSLEHGGR